MPASQLAQPLAAAQRVSVYRRVGWGTPQELLESLPQVWAKAAAAVLEKLPMGHMSSREDHMGWGHWWWQLMSCNWSPAFARFYTDWGAGFSRSPWCCFHDHISPKQFLSILACSTSGTWRGAAAAQPPVLIRTRGGWVSCWHECSPPLIWEPRDLNMDGSVSRRPDVATGVVTAEDRIGHSTRSWTVRRAHLADEELA